MKTVAILDRTDAVLPDDWCRPLALVTMSGGMSDSMSFKNRVGRPENNVEWVRAKHVLGSAWLKGDSTVAELEAEGLRYEFVRGAVPAAHRLDLSGYTL